MGNSKITILDVAEKAGVSKGTVDRVLHNRGEVSAKSALKVKKAIEELGYEPNIYASLLASRKQHVIACLLPKFEQGEYWEKVYNGFMDGGAHVEHLSIAVQVFFYDQYEVKSFRSACDRLLESNPSGVVIPPQFRGETMRLADRLHSKGIPYVYIDTKLEEDKFLAYIGMPMYKSGYLCAALLCERNPNISDVLVVRIKRDKTGLSDPTADRREGFNDFISTNFPSCQIHNVFIDPSDPKDIYKTLDAFFRENPKVHDIVMFNSRVHLLAPFLANHKDSARRVIGFDDLESNIEMLKDGLVDVLISQHTEMQGKDAITLLSDHILLHKFPQSKDNYVHMDILTRYNYENY